MSKKKTPPEKKEAEYEKDHFTFARHSPRGFRKTWKKKKNYQNRVVRRKSKNLLHEVQGLSLNELGPVEESLTAELFRKGLTKKKVRKAGVVNLREKIQKKKDRRENREETRRERKEQFAAIYTKGIIALERNMDGEAARALLDGLRGGDGRLWTFLGDNPEWMARLRTRMDQLQKQQQLAENKARLKQEQKWKWNSPALRIPKPIGNHSEPD
jgi:hypothetical protein